MLKQKATPQVLVATSDRELGDSIAGAHIVSSAALVREIMMVRALGSPAVNESSSASQPASL